MTPKLTAIKSLIEEISMGPFGSDIKVENFIDSGVPVLNGSNLSGVKLNEDDFKYVSEEKAISLKKANARAGDIVITHRGTLGQISYIPNDSRFDKYVISQSQFRVRFDSNKVDPVFITYYFHTNEGQKRLLANKSYVGVPALAQATTNFRRIEIPLPNLASQQKIAKVLSALDAKIELNNRINAELEAMAKLLYDYWFVQFDFPMTAAQAAALGKPHLKGQPYKSSGGKMVYNPILKREIPEGWEIGTLNQFISEEKTGDWGREGPDGNYTKRVSCIRGTDLNSLNGKGVTQPPTRYILNNNSHKILVPSDVIIEISGGSPTQSTGRVGLITEQVLQRFSDSLICSNFCKAIRIENPTYSHYFVHTWSQLYDNGVLFSWEGKTSGIKNLLFDSFLTHHYIFIPPNDLIAKFHQFSESLHKETQNLIKQNQELTTLRDWLLPMLMNGQISL